ADVENPLIAAKTQLVERVLPDLKLASSGGVPKTEGVRREEDRVGQRHRHEAPRAVGQPHREGRDGAADTYPRERQQDVRGVIAIVPATLHRFPRGSSPRVVSPRRRRVRPGSTPDPSRPAPPASLAAAG